MMGRRGYDPEPPWKKMTVPELLTKNITVLELPMKKFLIQIPEKKNYVSRIPILHNSEFALKKKRPEKALG